MDKTFYLLELQSEVKLKISYTLSKKMHIWFTIGQSLFDFMTLWQFFCFNGTKSKKKYTKRSTIKLMTFNQ